MLSSKKNYQSTYGIHRRCRCSGYSVEIFIYSHCDTEARLKHQILLSRRTSGYKVLQCSETSLGQV